MLLAKGFFSYGGAGDIIKTSFFSLYFSRQWSLKLSEAPLYVIYIFSFKNQVQGLYLHGLPR